MTSLMEKSDKKEIGETVRLFIYSGSKQKKEFEYFERKQ